MLGYIQAFDTNTLLWIQEHLRVAFLNGPMVFVSTLGNAGIFWIVLGLVLALIPRTRRAGILALASLLVCFLCNNVLLKDLVARPRPYTQIPELTMLMACPSDFSFPSGHACSSFAVSGSLMWTMRRSLGTQGDWIRLPALALAILVAFSRLYVGVHYPTDVLVGTAIGLLGSWLVTKYGGRCYDLLAQKRRRSDQFGS